MIALHSYVHVGHEQAYDETHARIPDDLVAAFARVGIRNWTIWRSGRDLFHLVDCDDFPAAVAQLASEPANERWQQLIGPHVERFEPAGPNGEPAAMGQVWTLADQQ